jgi:hypothetical protein
MIAKEKFILNTILVLVFGFYIAIGSCLFYFDKWLFAVLVAGIFSLVFCLVFLKSLICCILYGIKYCNSVLLPPILDEEL